MVLEPMSRSLGMALQQIYAIGASSQTSYMVAIFLASQIEILTYVELFAQFASEDFGNDISELVRSHYPCEDVSLLDDVLAIFILHHPEHGHAILHALLSCIIDGTLPYDKRRPPFGSFISLFSPSEHLQKGLSEQWALACGEVLKVLTHYNRPIYKADNVYVGMGSTHIVTCEGGTSSSNHQVQEPQATSEMWKQTPIRLLTPWITDSLLAAPLGVKSDYFRWCGGVMGKYAAGGELKPPTTVNGPGKQPRLMPSTPRWAVANGAAVILSVCDDEVLRYETADLTAAAVPALLLPPPTTALDEHLVAGLPPLEPYARLFHRYYTIASPGATQRLFLGLLEAPPSWAPDALDAAVQLMELLRAAEDYGSSMQLPRNWLHLHFLRPIGAAMAMQSGLAADAAAALLFRVFSQPALLFPPPGHGQDLPGRELVTGSSSSREQVIIATSKATEEATARGIASLMRDHGSDVEWRICTLWEAALGILPISSSSVDLPKLVIATPLQPPLLSLNLFRPLVGVLEYLPSGSPSESCMLKIFTATVEIILHRTFSLVGNHQLKHRLPRNIHNFTSRLCPNNVNTELRSMIHSLFTDTCASALLAARLLSVAFTVCLSHDAIQQDIRKTGSSFAICPVLGEETSISTLKVRSNGSTMEERHAVATFDSYIIAALCALACEVQLLSVSSSVTETSKLSFLKAFQTNLGNSHPTDITPNIQNGALAAIDKCKHLLRLLEALLSSVPSAFNVRSNGSASPGEIVAMAVVAAHISEVLGKSKACMHALATIMRCTWEPILSTKAANVLTLVEGNRKVVTAVVDNEGPHCTSSEVNEFLPKDDADSYHEERSHDEDSIPKQSRGAVESLQACQGCCRDTNEPSELAQMSVSVTLKPGIDSVLYKVPLHASDVVSLLCMDTESGLNDTVGSLVKAVLQEREDLSVAAVPLLWRRLVTAPEDPVSGESTSAKRGCRQVIEALCCITLVHPRKTILAILSQAERNLEHLIVNNNEQEATWRASKHIICLLNEVLRLQNSLNALKEVANASYILEKMTEGMAGDGEALTVSQLELLEAATLAIKVLVNHDGSGVNSLRKVLKRHLPSVVSCLSHNSAHVRAPSVSLLQKNSYWKIVSSDVHGRLGDTKLLEQSLLMGS